MLQYCVIASKFNKDIEVANMKRTLAFVCLAVAIAAASATDVNELHKKLQAADPSLASLSSKASTMYYDDKYESKYGKYEDKYYKKYEDKYEKKYDDKYYKEDKYEDKYYGYYDYKYDYGYGDKKVAVKLWEKSRSELRPQPLNPDTFQFSSTVTCTNPHKVKDIHSHDGIIDLPVDKDLKVIPVGVCEWTITKVKEQDIGEHASIKGSTNVVCTFTEEAERQCPHEVLAEGLSVSAQGLLYHFDKKPADYSYYKKEDKYEKKEEEDGEIDLDVILSLINGVNTKHGKGTKSDNGVIQFFLGSEDGKKKAANAGEGEVDLTGQYTIVFTKEHY